MGGHLYLLQVGVRECDAWSSTLLDRLQRTPIGSLQSRELRKELREYLDGRQSECAAAEAVYAEASDRYLSVLLALLTGAGAVGGIALGLKAHRKPPADQP